MINTDKKKEALEKLKFFYDVKKCEKGEFCQRAAWDYDVENLEMNELDYITGDGRLSGLFGLHVGDAFDWIPILVVEYGRDLKDVKILEIDCEGMYFIEDPCPIDKGSVPSSSILVYTNGYIPKERIKVITITKNEMRYLEEAVEDLEEEMSRELCS